MQRDELYKHGGEGVSERNVILKHTSYFAIEMTTPTLQAINVDEKEPTKQCIHVGTHSLHGFEVLCLRAAISEAKTTQRISGMIGGATALRKQMCRKQWCASK